MKYLSILSLMTAFAAFSSDAMAADMEITLNVSGDCAPCLAALKQIKTDCNLSKDIAPGEIKLTSTCTGEEIKEKLKAAHAELCPTCTIDISASK